LGSNYQRAARQGTEPMSLPSRYGVIHIAPKLRIPHAREPPNLTRTDTASDQRLMVLKPDQPCQRSLTKCLHRPRKILLNNEVTRASEKAKLFEREEDFILNVLNCGLQLRPKELNDDTIFPQNRFKTLKRPLKKDSLKNRHRCLRSRIKERLSKS
jgi:5-methylcytosine-specific restriction endonuclease McrA